jgi:hypothetical protein
VKKRIDILIFESVGRLAAAALFAGIALFGVYAVAVHGAWWHLFSVAAATLLTWFILKKW